MILSIDNNLTIGFSISDFIDKFCHTRPKRLVSELNISRGPTANNCNNSQNWRSFKDFLRPRLGKFMT